MTAKPITPENLLKGIALTDDLVRVTEDKVRTLKTLRRTLAREAIKQGLVSGRIVKGQPCPLCGHPTTLFDAHGLSCRICKYDGRGHV